MTKRKINLFQRVKQFFYEDGGDIHWWIDEEDLENFKDMFSDSFEEDEIKCTDEREINGKQWNEWMFGQYFDDYSAKYKDEDCPECGHLVVFPDDEFQDEVYCSNNYCDYISLEMDKKWEEEKELLKRDEDAPESPKFREAGQTIEEFAVKHGFRNWEEMECGLCNKVVKPNDFYISFGYAQIHYVHDNCTNKGPAKFIPFSKEEKEKWYGALS